MLLGILRETRFPPDRRVPFTPGQLKELEKKFPGLECFIQPSDIRAFSDEEYREYGITVREDLSVCDVLMGIKEVSVETLIPGKTYLFFSHTGKKQPHNRNLLKAIVSRHITLVDYEYLADTDGLRLVHFGRWAGIVGAYNGLRAWGERYGLFLLKPAHQCHDKQEMVKELPKVKLPAIKILVSGGGRVAKGAMEMLQHLQLQEVEPDDFLIRDFGAAVICRIDPWHYVKRADGSDFELNHFFSYPDLYESTFKPFTRVTDFLIAGHYWNPRSPVFMAPSDIRDPEFRIRVVADISCDVPGSIPSTIRAASIAEPFYGYDPLQEREISPFDPRGITVMAVDNLPAELPRDASEDFGRMLIDRIMSSLACDDMHGIIGKATIVRNGKLTDHFGYLADYIGT